MPNLKIFHILDHYIPHYSGYTFRTASIVRHQRLLGIEPTLLISPKHTQGLARRETIDDIECFRSAYLNDKNKIQFWREYALMEHFRKDILQAAQNKHPKIIHAHSPLLNGFPALKVARKLNVPIIYEVRAPWEDAAVDLGRTKEGSLRYRLTKYLETDLLKKVDCIITICESLKQEFIKRGIDPKKINVIPNGVDTQRFKPKAPDQNILNRHRLNGKTVIGFIGSFYKYEGLSLLIKAMPKIIQACPNTVLMLVGTGEVEQQARKLAKTMQLNGSIIFTGQVPNEEITDYYSIMDMLVYPREKIRLTNLVTPLKPLEAMAMGKVVLGSDVGGIQEITQNGKTGALFQAGNTDDFSSQCICLLKDEPKRNMLRHNAAEYVKTERNWETIVNKELEIYAQVIAKSKYKPSSL